MSYRPTTYEIIFDGWCPRHIAWKIRFFTPDVDNADGTQGHEWDAPGGYRTRDLATADARAILGIA